MKEYIIPRKVKIGTKNLLQSVATEINKIRTQNNWVGRFLKMEDYLTLVNKKLKSNIFEDFEKKIFEKELKEALKFFETKNKQEVYVDTKAVDDCLDEEECFFTKKSIRKKTLCVKGFYDVIATISGDELVFDTQE